MSPFPLLQAEGEGADEMMELQNSAHYNANIPNRPPVSILGSLNSVLNAVRSGDSSNGSQTGSTSGLHQNSSLGQSSSEEESDLVVLLALFIPLAITVTAIFIIALLVRKMRRTESMQEVEQSNKTELEMTPRKKKISAQSTASTMSSASSTSSNHSLTPSRSVKGFDNRSRSHKLESFSSSGSIYHTSSCLRHSSHLQLQYQSSLPNGLASSPTGLPPQWPLYTRSHYGLNKLHQQLYQETSLQSAASMQNLSGAPLTRQYSAPPQTYSYCTQSDPEMDADGAGDESKKSPNKKLKRVLSAMNFPRKIKQYQADRKRFNVYTIPVEVREQLKHIYVY